MRCNASLPLQHFWNFFYHGGPKEIGSISISRCRLISEIWHVTFGVSPGSFLTGQTSLHWYGHWSCFKDTNLVQYIDDFVIKRRNSSALAMELRLSCINPSIWILPRLIVPRETPYTLRHSDYFYMLKIRTQRIRLQWPPLLLIGMDKWFHPTLHHWCNYLSMMGLKLNHVSKRGPCPLFTMRYGILLWPYIARLYAARLHGTMSAFPPIFDRHLCCTDTCKISERPGNSTSTSRVIQISRDLTVKSIIAHWKETMDTITTTYP